MKDEILEMLKLHQEENYDIIWTLDENWNIKNPQLMQEKNWNMRELFGVDADCWENIEKIISWKGHHIKCTLECNRNFAYRTVKLKLLSEEEKIEIDPTQFRGLLQYIMVDIQRLYDCANPNDEELLKAINRMVFHQWQIYRPVYIKMLLKKIHNKKERKESFEISHETEHIRERMEEIFGENAKITFQHKNPEKKRLFLCEDKNLFYTAVLSGVILCCPLVRNKLKIQIQVTYAGNTAEILVQSATMKRQCKDSELQPDNSIFQNDDDEIELLKAFTSRHGGTFYEIQPESDSGKKRSFRLLFQEDASSGILMSSRFSRDDGKFNDVCHIMLSRILFQPFFAKKQ